MIQDSKLSKIKKIRELALNGVGGEKENAEELLNNLLAKYDISLDSINNEEVLQYEFEYHGGSQKKLLIQIIWKVTNLTYHYDVINNRTGRRSKTELRVDCTESQKIEIDILFEFYCRLWDKEVKRLLSAFIMKHDIFGTDLGEADKTEWDDEELAKVAMMSRCLSDDEPVPMIEERSIS